jgi:hypothetical protein
VQVLLCVAEVAHDINDEARDEAMARRVRALGFGKSVLGPECRVWMAPALQA